MKIPIKNIIAFCILMESDGGILNKSPDYVKEKFERYCLSEREDEGMWGLDVANYFKLKDWEKQWLNDENKILSFNYYEKTKTKTSSNRNR